MTKYTNQLPRLTGEFARCQSLDDDGNRCDNPAKYEIDIHQDRQTGGDLWLTVKVCLECREHGQNWFKESSEAVTE
jgi:hypothetical protein